MARRSKKKPQLELFGEIGPRMGDVERWAQDSGYGTLIGVDEAGRGPLAGPVVVGAVVLDLDEAREQGWLGRVADSKQLVHSEREALFDLIRKNARFCAVTQSEAWEIDQINILQATLTAMARAVKTLRAQCPDERPFVIVDGNRPIPGVENQRTVVKGDARSYHVAAASILAKVSRDRILARYDEHWPCYGFAQHKGYPTRKHRHAVLTEGRCPVHRLTFKVSPLSEAELKVKAKSEELRAKS